MEEVNFLVDKMRLEEKAYNRKPPTDVESVQNALLERQASLRRQAAVEKDKTTSTTDASRKRPRLGEGIPPGAASAEGARAASSATNNAEASSSSLLATKEPSWQWHAYSRRAFVLVYLAFLLDYNCIAEGQDKVSPDTMTLLHALRVSLPTPTGAQTGGM